MFYNARWYDPVLGRFAQADTIFPPGVQGLDRYAYVGNNPVRYSDPSRHTSCEGDNWDDGPQCMSTNEFKDNSAKYNEVKKIQAAFKNIRIENILDWNLTDLQEIYKALWMINKNGFNNHTDAFIKAFGDVIFTPVASGSLGSVGGNDVVANADYSNGLIKVTSGASVDTIIHEMAHIFDGNLRRINPRVPFHSQDFVDAFNNSGSCTVAPCSGSGYSPSGSTSVYGISDSDEDFADSFMFVITGQTQYIDSNRIQIINALLQSYTEINHILSPGR